MYCMCVYDLTSKHNNGTTLKCINVDITLIIMEIK